MRKPEMCRGCVLYGDGQSDFTLTEGTGEIRLLVCAEAPGASEAEEARPLSPNGASGKVFRRALRELGIPARRITITNMLRSRPPGNELRGADYERAALDHCRSFLDRTVEEVKPTVILALGDVPFRELVAERPGTVTSMRGFVFQSTYGIPLVPTYHPAFIARGAWQLYGAFKHDISFAARCAVRGVPAATPTTYQLRPAVDDVNSFIRELSADQSRPVSYDVETAHILGEVEPEDWRQKRIVQIQFSDAVGQAIVLPWDDGEYRDLARRILALPNPKWGWNSRLSDDLVLESNGFVINGERHDLMNCLRGDTKIKLWDGSTKTIREVVDQRLAVTLVGMDEQGQQIPVEITDWHHKKVKMQPWVGLLTDINRYPVNVTPDHLIWTQHGWKEAKDIVVGDWVPTATRGAEDVLEGMLLGDSHFSVSAYSVVTAHSSLQRRYAQAMASYLGVKLHDAPNSSDPRKRIVYFRVTAPFRWRDRFYPVDDGQKRFSPPTTNRALAIWYMDDGSFDAYTGKLAARQTKRFTHHQGDGAAMLCLSPEFMDQVDAILQWFQDAGFGNQIAVQHPKSSRGGLIYIKRDTRDRFFEAVAPYIHPSMQYKLPARYHNLYNGWMERPEPQWGQVVRVNHKSKRNGFMTDRYCVDVDHSTHRFFAVGGLVHNCWGHLQPSFWGGKSDVDTDKGVPSRLMGLQSCTSFYSPEVGPWKHLGTPEAIKANPSLLPLYGAYDADYTHRCGEGIMSSLEAQGLMVGYRTHKLDLRPTLDYLGEIGLPVDRTAQADLRVYVQDELKSLRERIQQQVPTQLLTLHPKDGWKGIVRSLATIDGEVGRVCDYIEKDYDPEHPPFVVMGDPAKAATRKSKPAEGYLVERCFVRNAVGEDVANAPHPMRWCLQKLYNPHGSSPNTKAYIRAMGYRMPTALDSGEETTGKLELQKLADETGDEVLKLTGEWREFAQVANNYSGGHWIPEADGRVHAEFRWGTASAQLVAVRPPVMTYPEHSELAKRVKEVIRAQPGHMLVKIDKRGYHARMTGWLARDPVYYRIADFDVHSFVTAGFLHLPDAPYLIDMADDELAGSLIAIKAEHGHTRNYKVKRVVHGVTFGAKVNKIYGMYGPNFDPKPDEMIAEVGEARWYDWDRERQMREVARRGRATAQALINTLAQQFPRTFILFPEWVREQIYNVTKCRLVSPFGHHRLFWNFDMEQATAYLPSNCSHCDFQAALVRMDRAKVLRTFEAINSNHDALWLHPQTELVEDGIAAVQEEFDKPSTVLVDNPLGPFQCNSDAEVGPNLAWMVPVDLWRRKGRPDAASWAEVSWKG